MDKDILLSEEELEERGNYVPPEIMKPIVEEFKQLKDKEILDYLNESFKLPLKLYHGATTLYDELRPVGIDLGNSLQDPCWSLFCWRDYDSAVGWAIFCVIKTLKRNYPENINHKGCINSKKAIIDKSTYEFLLNHIQEIDTELLTYYVYTIKPESNFKFGLGHSSNTPGCITIRNDHIKPYKIDQRILSISDINKYCSIVDDGYKPNKKELGIDKRFLTFLMKYDYMYNNEVKKKLQDDINNGLLEPGDDLMQYFRDNNIELNKVSIKDRLFSEEYIEEKDKEILDYLNESISNNITYSTSFNDVKKVIDSLSDDDINRICNGTFKNSPYVIYREVLLVNKKPVSFIDVYKLPNMKEDGCIVIATNPKYRNMGYGSILISNMKKRLKGKNLIWKTQNDNDISISLAKKYEYNPIIEEYIEEKGVPLETILSTNPLEKEITLYHGSDKKVDKINPIGYNAGTRLSRARMSSFWAPEPSFCKLFALFRLINSFDKDLICAVIHSDLEHLMVLKKDADKIKSLIRNKECYVYEKTIDKKYVGIGHAVYGTEFTIDVPVVPDKVEVYDAIDLYKEYVLEYDNEEDIKNDFKALKDVKYKGKSNLNRRLIIGQNYANKKIKAIKKDTLTVRESYIEERAKYDTAGYESKYFEKDDAIFNMDKWNPYSNNILYITGISGSGKTTLANDLQERYNIERIELDYIIAYYIKKFIDADRRKNFVKHLQKDCPDVLEFFTPERDERILLNKWNEHKPVTDEFMTWFLQTHSNNGTLYIINGAQIADSDVLNDQFLHDKPIIIKHGGSSVLKSVLRRLNRELKYAENIPHMFRIVKSNAKLLSSKSGYLDGIKRLKDMNKSMQKEEALSMSEYEPLENIFVPLYTPEELENTGIYDKEPDGVNPMAFAHAKQWFDNYKNLGYISEDYENKILYILHSGKVNEADSMLRLYGWDPDVSINEIRTRQEKVRNYLQEQRKVTLVNLTESAEEEESFVYELKGIKEVIKRRINEFINSSSKFAPLASSTTEDNKDGDGEIPEYDEEHEAYSIFRVHTHDGIKLDLIDDYVSELNNYLHLVEEKYEIFYEKLNSDFYCIYVKPNTTTGDTGFVSNMESTALSSASLEKDTPEAVPEEIRIKSLDDLFVKYSDREEKGISPIV